MHIYGEGSSWDDQDVAYVTGWAGYVVTSSRKLLRINRKSSYEYEDVTVKKLIRYIPLSNEEKSTLVKKYQPKWDEHKNNCEYGTYTDIDCSSVKWPQEPSWIRILTSSWSW